MTDKIFAKLTVFFIWKTPFNIITDLFASALATLTIKENIPLDTLGVSA